MTKEIALVLTDPRDNRNSVTGLITALEAHDLDGRYRVRAIREEADFIRALSEADATGKYAVGGITFLSAQTDLARSVVSAARAALGQSIFLVAGGPHPSGDPRGTLTMGFDAVVTGEGEIALPELLARLEAGNGWRDTPGIACLDEGGEYRRNPRPPEADLSSILPLSERHRRYGPIEISRGCPFACRYCQTSSHFGTRMRHRPASLVAEGAAMLARRGMRDVRVLTPDALAYGSTDGREANLPAVEDLFRLVREAAGERGRIWFGTFPSEVRPEHVTTEAMELLAKYAYNRTLVIGGQSGSEAVLAASHREHGRADIVHAARTAANAGFQPLVDMIFALPGETDDDREQTLELCEELLALGARVHVHHFMPLPGSAWRDRLPEVLPPTFVKRMNRLLTEGRYFGDFREQYKLAREAVREKSMP